MKQKRNLLLIGLLSFFFLFSCNEDKECFSPPQPFGFKFIGSDSELVALSDVELVYDDTKKVDITHHEGAEVYESTEIGWLSSGGTKTFYVTYNNEEQDTLFIDVREKNEDGCIFFETIDVQYNGETVEDIAPNTGVYIFQITD